MSVTSLLRLVACSAVACVALTLGSNPAEARVPRADPRVDSLAYTCGCLQDRFDAIIADMKRQGSSISQAQHDAYMSELRDIGRSWAAACTSFGSIAYKVNLPTGKLPTDAVQGQPTLATDGGSGAPSKGVKPVGGLHPRSVLKKN